jgi:hypothetical protein
MAPPIEKADINSNNTVILRHTTTETTVGELGTGLGWVSWKRQAVR